MGFRDYLKLVLKEGMTTTNLNITKVGSIILLVLGLYFFFDAKEDSKAKEYLGIVTIIVGGVYALYTLVGGVKLMMSA